MLADTKHWLNLHCGAFILLLLLLSDKLSYKTSLVVRSEILGQSFNTVKAYHMFSLQNWGNSRNKFKRNYLQNQNHFLKVLLHFWNFHKILCFLKKKIILISYSLRRKWLLKCPKGLVLERSSAVNVFVDLKRCLNLNCGGFTLILDYFQTNQV